MTQSRPWASHSSKEVEAFPIPAVRGLRGFVSFPEVPVCFLQNHNVNDRLHFPHEATGPERLSLMPKVTLQARG